LSVIVRERPRQASPPPPRRPQRSGSNDAGIYKRRSFFAGVLLATVVYGIWLAWGFVGALTNPAFGSSMSARAAEWAREQGGAPMVNWIEKEWYAHHQPPIGGKPAAGLIKQTKATTPLDSTVPHLTPPPPVRPVASPAIPGEGQWAPAGRLVHGLPAVYVTTMRPDAVHTSQVVALAWMDPKLLRATLYSGSQIPGGGPYPNTAPIGPTAATSLVSAFNAGFLLSDSNGGYYTNGQTIVPLRTGAASVVINKNGNMTIGQWGRDAKMSSSVVSVRQNLDLLVDDGAPVPGLSDSNSNNWGATLGGGLDVWRSGIGETLSGAIVYVGGPSLSIQSLANLLVRAGAFRGMELDINTDWVNYATYAPAVPGAAATAADGTDLLPNMTGTPGRYFADWWTRDFFTMSAR
jgi:hypothetical protein